MRFEGILKSWNDERGFGFIEPIQGGQEIFVHIKSFTSRDGRPQVNQPLSFEVEVGPQGKKRAKNVQVVRPSKSRKPSDRQLAAQWGTATLFALPGFLLGYLVVAILWRPPLWFAGAYLLMSLVTFGIYAADKSAAKQSASRTPENVLHTLALAGGWPGALLAQQVLRHKSTKTEFRTVFWATVVLNCAGFAMLCSPIGRQFWATQ